MDMGKIEKTHKHGQKTIAALGREARKMEEIANKSLQEVRKETAKQLLKIEKRAEKERKMLEARGEPIAELVQ